MIAILRGELECSSSSSGLTDREHPVESIHQRLLTLTYLSLSLSICSYTCFLFTSGNNDSSSDAATDDVLGERERVRGRSSGRCHRVTHFLPVSTLLTTRIGANCVQERALYPASV